MGCKPPLCDRDAGNVISTTSSRRTLSSCSRSNFAVASSRAAAIAAFASPMIFPTDAFWSAGSDPSDRLARAIGDLSPAWASRASLSESKSWAAAKALRA